MKNTKKIAYFSYNMALVAMLIHVYFIKTLWIDSLFTIWIISVSSVILIHIAISRIFTSTGIIKEPKNSKSFITKVAVWYIKGFVAISIIYLLLSVTSLINAVFIYSVLISVIYLSYIKTINIRINFKKQLKQAMKNWDIEVKKMKIS